jgi:peptidyl-prolyl cis-trans isomerase C
VIPCAVLSKRCARSTALTSLAATLQELASEHSTCPSGKNGGSLGEFSPGQMVKEFNDVVFTTGKVGQVEGPVKTQFGYHLILITRRGDEKM